MDGGCVQLCGFVSLDVCLLPQAMALSLAAKNGKHAHITQCEVLLHYLTHVSSVIGMFRLELQDLTRARGGDSAPGAA